MIPQIVLSFAKEVGSIRRLELSNGPLGRRSGRGRTRSVLTDWKMKLIEDLYLRTRWYFETGDLQTDNDALADELRRPDWRVYVRSSCRWFRVPGSFEETLRFHCLRRASPGERCCSID